MNRPPTEAQIQASRANGALSRGAITREGKAKCAQSNARHGLLSHTILVTGESSAEFIRLLDNLIREFDPQTEGELRMVEELVVCKWRQMRIWSIAASALSDEIDEQCEKAPELLDRSLPSRAMAELHRGRAAYPSLHRYETACSRKYKRLFDRLTALKAQAAPDAAHNTQGTTRSAASDGVTCACSPNEKRSPLTQTDFFQCSQVL